MRDYAKVAPVFWTRGSGKMLRGDRDAQLVALYLFTCASANMIGLYYLPMSLLCHETGLDYEGACKALRRVCKADVAVYDESSELVFVANMARYQIGVSLKRSDKRVLGIQRELDTYSKHAFAHQFFDLYHNAYHLRPLTQSPSPSEGPSKPLRSQDQDQDQEQEGETRAPVTVAEAASETRIRAITNASDDGAFGGAVASWAEGIRLVTGKPFIAPTRGPELEKLVRAIVTYAPDMDKRIDWARDAGRRFAQTNRGKLNAHSFVDWLNTPSHDGAASEEEHRKRRDAEERVWLAESKKREAEAVPIAASPVREIIAMLAPKKAGGGGP